jgi:hypothetical protein
LGLDSNIKVDKMIELFKKFVVNRILPYVFISSRHSFRFDELLQANQYHDDGLLIDPKRFGFRLKLGRAYITYIILLHVVILPILAIFHSALVHLDCHVSILLVMLFTWVFFALFTIYKEWLYELMAMVKITNAWELHLPLFDYIAHHEEVADIYSKAIKLNIPKNDLEMFVLDNLSSK